MTVISNMIHLLPHAKGLVPKDDPNDTPIVDISGLTERFTRIDVFVELDESRLGEENDDQIHLWVIATTLGGNRIVLANPTLPLKGGSWANLIPTLSKQFRADIIWVTDRRVFAALMLTLPPKLTLFLVGMGNKIL